jgi:multiple sugar transport system permease protein
MKRKFSYHHALWLMLLPYLLGSLILVILPALATVAVAFTEYNSIAPPRWAGMDNFWAAFQSSYVRIALYNSLIFLALAVPLRVVGALLLALLLQAQGRLFSAFRAAVYVPSIIPEVAYALIWLWIFNPAYGPLNLVLGLLNLPTPAWLAEPLTAGLAIVILMSFQLGEGFIICLIALRSIPRPLYEAARVDGASAWQSFWRITLPLLTPWLLLLTGRDLLMSLQNTFTPSFVLTYGGPYYATTFAPLLIYELSFDFFDFGLAGAVLVILYLLMTLFMLSLVSLMERYFAWELQ